MADTEAQASAAALKSKTPSPKLSPKSPKSPAGPLSTETNEPIQPDANLDDEDGDAESTISSTQSSTGSLTESIFAYRTLHGRTYNGGKAEYWAPNDEQQNEGLDLLHNCFLMVMEDKLFLAPIGPNPQRVLDVGTGTGIWAIDFGDMYPSAEVIGTDLSPIQPSWVPPNVQFQIDDCLQAWTWPADHFDFVHMRALYGSIPDWDELYAKAFKHTKPGGWVQDLEMDVQVQSDHVPIGEDHIFREWGRLYYEVGERQGKTFAISTEHRMRDGLIKAGFVDVTEVKIKIPCHSWPRDKNLSQAGLLCLTALDQSMEGLGLFLFTTYLGWTAEQVIVFCAKFRKEVRKRSNCGWIATTIAYGRKPEKTTEA